MGTTFVQINNKGFWIKDGILELWLRLAALHIKDSLEENSEAHKIRDQWLIASRGYFNGCVPDGISEAVATNNGKYVITAAINSLLTALDHAPEKLDKNTLNLLGFSDVFVHNFESFRLIEVSEAILKLIEGKIDTEASETSFMPGCR